MPAHYAVAGLSTGAYKATDKANVEQGARLVERCVMARLRKRRFTLLGSLSDAIDEPPVTERAPAFGGQRHKDQIPIDILPYSW
jgi:transposase